MVASRGVSFPLEATTTRGRMGNHVVLLCLFGLLPPRSGKMVHLSIKRKC
jgi:hypothetical protein